jgi:sec-independent protein translocase protein TatB
MFDLGFSELVVVVVLAVILLGPQEIPRVMRMMGRIVRRIQYVRYAFSQQFEEFMRENDLDDIRKSVNFEDRKYDPKDIDEAAADEEDVVPYVKEKADGTDG